MSSTVLGLTVGDSGVTISGTIQQKQMGLLSGLTGCSVLFSLIDRSTGAYIVENADGTLGTLDQANNAVTVSYRLQAADVANPVASAKVRWTFVLPDGGEIHAPSPREPQTYVVISA